MEKIKIVVKMWDAFFAKTGLESIIGIREEYWPIVVIKELIDNALDAIEACNEKQIIIEAKKDTFGVFDCGNGITVDALKKIYDFNNYFSENRFFQAPSRGQQGVGLKSIIGMSVIEGFQIIWHMNEGKFIVDINNKFDEMEINIEKIGQTDKIGVEIKGYERMINFYNIIENWGEKYHSVNPDVHFIIKWREKKRIYSATATSNEKNHVTHPVFYSDVEQYERLIKAYATEYTEITYSQFVKKIFGTALSNVVPKIKKKIGDINWDDEDRNIIRQNLDAMKNKQTKKGFTILKNNCAFSDDIHNMLLVNDSNTGVPTIVEVKIEKNNVLTKNKKVVNCICFINNSITYCNGDSIIFDEKNYKVGNKKEKTASNLKQLLMNYNEYNFTFHFISSQFIFMDQGKMRININGFIDELVSYIKKRISKEKNREIKTKKTPSKRDIMRSKMDEAFKVISSEGKYNVTVRQLYYKVRELASVEEKELSYLEFSQIIATEWINTHPKEKNLVYFSDRGVIYMGDNERHGIGTNTMLRIQNQQKNAKNIVEVSHEILSEKLKFDFNLKYQYSSILYIEKTGFDGMFLSEKIGEKYNMIILSGQGYATRSAKEILKICQDQGLKIYCMHDLDVAGVGICKSLSMENEKFQGKLNVIDLGITPADIQKYKIKPEILGKPKKEDVAKIKQMSSELQSFFLQNGNLCRAELSALTTEQILDLFETKIGSKENQRELISLANSVVFNKKDMLNQAILKLFMDKYQKAIFDVFNENDYMDISKYDKLVSFDELPRETEKLENMIIEKIKNKLEKNLCF